MLRGLIPEQTKLLLDKNFSKTYTKISHTLVDTCNRTSSIVDEGSVSFKAEANSLDFFCKHASDFNENYFFFAHGKCVLLCHRTEKIRSKHITVQRPYECDLIAFLQDLDVSFPVPEGAHKGIEVPVEQNGFTNNFKLYSLLFCSRSAFSFWPRAWYSN